MCNFEKKVPCFFPTRQTACFCPFSWLLPQLTDLAASAGCSLWELRALCSEVCLHLESLKKKKKDEVWILQKLVPYSNTAAAGDVLSVCQFVCWLVGSGAGRVAAELIPADSPDPGQQCCYRLHRLATRDDSVTPAKTQNTTKSTSNNNIEAFFFFFKLASHVRFQRFCFQMSSKHHKKYRKRSLTAIRLAIVFLLVS